MRAWGAPPKPKAPKEKRAELEQAAPPPYAAAAHAALLPKLGAGGASPRAAAKAAASPSAWRTWRLKGQRAPPQAEPKHAEALAAAAPWQQQPAALDHEDEDAVCIGSVAPSFSQPAAAAAEPAAEPAAVPPPPAVPAPPRRVSLLSTQLGSEDLSLAVLASRGGTRGSSRGSSRPSSAGSGVGGLTAAEPSLPLGADSTSYGPDFEADSPGPKPQLEEAPAYAPDWEVESPGAGSLPPPQQAPACCQRALSSADMAVLRCSLAELGLGGGPPAAGAAAAAAAQPPDMPDQVVLQELGRRLGRLDSQKRRVLLQVLAKIESAAAAGGAAAAGAAPPPTGGVHVDRSDASAAAHHLLAASLSSASAASDRAASADEASTGRPGRPMPAEQWQQQEEEEPPSPGKQGGFMGKLAALRLGRAQSLGRSSIGGGSGGAGQQPPPAPAVSAMVQPRHSERRRPPNVHFGSGQQQQGEAHCAARQSGGRLTSAGDTLAAFAQDAAAEGQQAASLAGSPTVLALGAFYQQPDALDAAAAGARSPAAGARRSGSGSGSGDFLIPRCPSGRVLQLSIHSTWGDPHYVGLAGLELFDAHGRPLTIRDAVRQVGAAPESINVLPEYGSDLRTPDKLVDGVYLTCDDRHMWLAPFTPGAAHTVTLSLDAAATLGAIRVWNYNKSRVGSLRGARRIDVTLDGAPIFRGELRQAPGSVAEALRHAELVLFTEEPAALAAIEVHDRRYARQLSPPGSGPDSGGAAAGQLDIVTAGTGSPGGHLSAQGEQLGRTSPLAVLQPGVKLGSSGRPLTSALPPPAASPPVAASSLRGSGTSSPGSRGGSTSGGAAGGGGGVLRCRELALVLLESWGDSHFVGLSGLQVLGADRQALRLGVDALAADPPDLNVFPGHSGDVRTVDKLVDGTANTMDDTHMWLAPIKRQLSPAVLTACQKRLAAAAVQHPMAAAVDRSALPEATRPYNVLLLRLAPAGGAPVACSALLLHNYNKSSQDAARGVKRMVVLADGVEVSPPGGVLVRRAPGTAAFEFGQLVPLSTCWSAAAAAAAGKAGAPRPRASLQQGGGKHAAAAAARQQPGPLAIHGESVAWACNLPDPGAALEYLQRAALLEKAAGPAGPLVSQPAENCATPLPCGFSLKLRLLSSWGDPHYIGLAGLELVDAVRGPLRLRGDQVHAAPASVASLPGMAADVRTPDKLVNGNSSGAAAHSWLAPLDRQAGNVVLLTLDAPVLLGAIRLWNYRAKAPARGVQEAEVYVDEQLVWKGVLQRAPAEPAPGEDWAQTLCFSEEAAQAAAAAARRHAAAAAKAGKAGRAGGGSVVGSPLGAEGVQEWRQRAERCVLFDNCTCVAPPEEGAALPTARPLTALVAA